MTKLSVWQQNNQNNNEIQKQYINQINIISTHCLSPKCSATATVVARPNPPGVEESLEALKILEKELKGRFFNGDSLGLVDIAGLFVAYWLPIVEEAGGLHYWFNGEKFPKLEKWSHEIVNHPTIKLALPPRDNLLAFAKAQFQSIAASK